MGLGDEIGKLLQQYTSANAPPDTAENDFDHVARNAPPEEVSEGLSEAFRSDRTPPFGEMVGQLFSQGDAQQRAGMVNQLLGGLNASALGSLLGGAGADDGRPGALGALGGLGNAMGGLGGGALAGILGGLLGGSGGDGHRFAVSPEQAERLSPEQVRELAEHAQRENPGIVEHMSQFYAQHPSLVKSLGGLALSIALGRMANRR